MGKLMVLSMQESVQVDAGRLVATMARLIRTGDRSLTEIWDSAALVER